MKLKLPTVRLLSSAFALIFLFSVEPILGQERSFKLGLNAGLLSSQVRGDNISGFNKFGFMGGAYVEYEFESDFYFEVGLNFIQKGSRQNADPDNMIFNEYVLALNYIEAPVLLKYNFYEKLYVVGGVTLGAMINYREESEGIPMNDKRGFSRMELGYLGGMGYRLSQHTALQVSYHGSITKIRDRDQPQGLDQRHQIVSVMLRYTF
jgi:opacity protein-like surface antigen